jgi:transcriptional regulator with XRE-family HTH domain
VEGTQPHAPQVEPTHAGGEAAPSVREQFAENLRRLRDRAGLSQEGLAGVCELHRAEVSLLERCQRSPRLETIVILSRGLELASPAELLEGIV